MSRKSHRQTFHRQGTVLLIVVVIVMLLSLVAYKFLLAMETEHMAAAIQEDRLQAQQSAYSARDLCMMMLKKSRSQRDAMGGMIDNPSYFAGDMTALTDTTATELTSNLLEQPPFGLVAYALPSIDEDAISGQRPAQPQVSSNGITSLFPPTRYGLINESAKLHLWKILQWETENPGTGFDALMSLPGMDEETAEALLDWLDADDDPRANGAESEFYATLTRPIAPRNGLPVDIDELLFVKGITPLRLFGTTTELPLTASSHGATPVGSIPSQYSANSLNQGNVNDTNEVARPWIEYLTIHGAERNESYTGEPRIFLNSDNLQELHSTISGVLPKEWADYIVLYRQFGPSETPPANSRQSNEAAITIDFEVPPKFEFENLLDLIGTAVSIPAEQDEEQERTVFSPSDVESLTVQTEAIEILDRLTILPERRIVGRINVNDAPAAVLSALPGLSEDTIESIVAARETQTEETVTSRVHPIWLLTEGIVNLESMRRLIPHVTCGGDVFRAEVWGRAEEQTPMVRFETVLDASTKQCRPVYYRELDAPRDKIKILSSEEFASLGITTLNDNRNNY